MDQIKTKVYTPLVVANVIYYIPVDLLVYNIVCLLGGDNSMMFA